MRDKIVVYVVKVAASVNRNDCGFPLILHNLLIPTTSISFCLILICFNGSCIAGVHKLYKNKELHKKSRRQKGEMKHVPY